jgi:hypothetical protein
VLEAADTEQFAQRDTGIVEAERLIEIACEQIDSVHLITGFRLDYQIPP